MVSPVLGCSTRSRIRLPLLAVMVAAGPDGLVLIVDSTVGGLEVSRRTSEPGFPFKTT